MKGVYEQWERIIREVILIWGDSGGNLSVPFLIFHVDGVSLRYLLVLHCTMGS